MIVGYSFLDERKEMEAGINSLGKSSIAVINTNIGGEKLKFQVGEAIDIARDLALKDVKDNGGVYDKTNCNKRGEYVVLGEDCSYLNSDVSFYYYFNDSFDAILKKYSSSYSSDNYNIEFENNVLGVENIEEVPLSVERISSEDKFDEALDHDNILEYVRKYGREYEIPENLIKALIMHESKGDIGAVNSNPDSTDYGVMQINDKAHPKFFDDTREDFVCNAREDIECNIKAGASILKSYYNAYGEGLSYVCTGEFYTGWKAALRGYNGLGCINENYVSIVWKKYEGEDVEIIGFLNVEIDYEDSVNFDFDIIENVILRAMAIKDCIINGDDVVVCTDRENRGPLVYLFRTPMEENNALKFDVEEITTGDFIKFALSI